MSSKSSFFNKGCAAIECCTATIACLVVKWELTKGTISCCCGFSPCCKGINTGNSHD